MKFKMLAAAAAFSTAGVIGAGTASAAPIITGGLVNVTVNDVTILEDVNVALGLSVAAAICDVNVNVLAAQFRAGDAVCTADSGDVVTVQR